MAENTRISSEQRDLDGSLRAAAMDGQAADLWKAYIQGGNANSITPDTKSTALMFAAIGLKENAIELLCALRAHPKARNDRGNTALRLAEIHIRKAENEDWSTLDDATFRRMKEGWENLKKHLEAAAKGNYPDLKATLDKWHVEYTSEQLEAAQARIVRESATGLAADEAAKVNQR